jgi:hypothetical protein
MFVLEDGAEDVPEFTDDSPIGVINANEFSDVRGRHCVVGWIGP